MRIISSVFELRRALSEYQNTSLVATMGNLHEGHLSLVRLAKNYGGPVVVSIFVNRLQFGPNEDFDSYPRTFESDAELLEREGVSILFAPLEKDIYPDVQNFLVRPSQELSGILEGVFRPDFCTGVATVVLKLINCVQPKFAIFSKKDYQQLLVVQNMVRQFNLSVEVVAAETYRSEDGLALSSRNMYLTVEERAEASFLFRVLQKMAAEIRSGCKNYSHIESIAMKLLVGRGWSPDYLSICQCNDLQPLHTLEDELKPIVILAAAKLGRTRLIDSIEV